MFKVNGVIASAAPTWMDDDSIFRTSDRFTPEQELLYAFLIRNIRDCYENYPLTRRGAYKWFKLRADSEFGWQWTADHLKLSSLTMRLIEALTIYR